MLDKNIKINTYQSKLDLEFIKILLLSNTGKRANERIAKAINKTPKNLLGIQRNIA